MTGLVTFLLGAAMMAAGLLGILYGLRPPAVRCSGCWQTISRGRPLSGESTRWAICEDCQQDRHEGIGV